MCIRNNWSLTPNLDEALRGMNIYRKVFGLEPINSYHDYDQLMKR